MSSTPNATPTPVSSEPVEVHISLGEFSTSASLTPASRAAFYAAVAKAAADLGIVVEVLSVDVCDPSDAGEVLETLVPA